MHGLKIAGRESRVTTTRNTTLARLSRNVPGVYLPINILIRIPQDYFESNDKLYKSCGASGAQIRSVMFLIS